MSGKKKTDGVTRVLNFGSGVVSFCSALLAIVLILYSGYVLYDSMAIEVSAFSANSDLLKYKPSVLGQATADQPSLSEVNPDYRAWITVGGEPASPIDYPVVQGRDDLYYASHDVYGEISLTGAIYQASGNSPDFSDSYNLLYGHHMDNGAMFGSLDQFRDENYFSDHQTAVLMAEDGSVYDVYFFAVITTDAYEKQIYTVGNRASEVLAFLNGSRDNDTGIGTSLLIYDRMAASGAEKILALSTCASADTAGRLVVLGKMTRRGEIEPTPTPTPTATGYSGGGGRKTTPTPTPEPLTPVKLTVKFLGPDDEPVFPDQLLIYMSGDTYYVVPPQYPGYDVDIRIVRGTIDGDMTVIVRYTPRQWRLRIRYIFPDGTEAAQEYLARMNTGEQYDVKSPVIKGYKTLVLKKSGTKQGKDEQYTVIYVPEDEELGDLPTPLGLERTFMQIGVCFE